MIWPQPFTREAPLALINVKKSNIYDKLPQTAHSLETEVTEEMLVIY